MEQFGSEELSLQPQTWSTDFLDNSFRFDDLDQLVIERIRVDLISTHGDRIHNTALKKWADAHNLQEDDRIVRVDGEEISNMAIPDDKSKLDLEKFNNAMSKAKKITVIKGGKKVIKR